MSDLISDEDLAALEEVLEGVTPGPWRLRFSLYDVESDKHGQIAACEVKNDAAHIARCDPRTIASLIARLRAAETRARIKEADARSYEEQAVEALAEHDALRAKVETLREALESANKYITLLPFGSDPQRQKTLMRIDAALAATEPTP